MKTFFRLSVVVILLVFLASCHHPNTQGRYIPADAPFAMLTYGKSLSSKLSWDDIKQNPLLQQALADSTIPANIRAILNNPGNSGIDLDANMIWFFEKDSVGSYLSFEGNIKDTTLFEKFIIQVDNSGSESEKGGVTFISKYPSCIGWDKDKFICVVDVPQFSQFNSYLQHLQNNPATNVPHNRDIGATCEALFNLDESVSLAKNDKFTKLVSETGDIHFWVNSQELYSGALSASPVLSMLNMDDIYKDNFYTGTVNFDNGKISFITKNYMNDKIAGLYKNYMTGKISDEMIQRIPGKVLNGVFAVNFKPEGIRDFLKLFNLDGAANGALKQFNLSIDDIVSAFKGDFVFGATDFNIKTDSATGQNEDGTSYTYPKTKAAGNFVFAASINDKDEFNKVFSAIKTATGLGMQPDTAVSYDNNGSFFVVSNSPKTTAGYLAGASNNFDIVSKIDDQPMAMYANIQSFLKGAQTELTKDSVSQMVYDASIKMWNNFYWKGGALDDNVASGSAEINLVDSSTNSLKQLNQYIITISTIIKQQNDKEKARAAAEMSNMPVDTAALPSSNP